VEDAASESPRHGVLSPRWTPLGHRKLRTHRPARRVVRLTASGEGVRPNCMRPKGFQVWNSEPMQVDTDLDYGDPNEELKPIRIVGTLGGAFSGKVLVGSPKPIKGLKAVMSDLVARTGGLKKDRSETGHSRAPGCRQPYPRVSGAPPL